MAQQARRRVPPRKESGAVPRRDWVVAAVAAAGFAVSSYLTYTKATASTALFCSVGTGCDIVQASRYAHFLGLPTAAWGVALYALLVGVCVAGLTPRRWFWVFLGAVGAVAFSAYLTFLSVFELRAVCPWCLTDAGIAVALLAVVLVRRPPLTGRRPVARPARLVTWGAAAFVATIVVAAGVWVTGKPSASAPYQEALARHLASTGSIMYGAYW